MTQEESSEVFLGPTGSETEEFYGFQRKYPGLEKAEYLEWFQRKFHKEIELRRRRSDQPSDLEYMVIKKRAKYRERITQFSEEAAELCSHSEAHPEKTYRELADWFYDRFGKSIDISAISRALKRNRTEAESGGSPHPDQTPPDAKRTRRSANEGSQSPGYKYQPPAGPAGPSPPYSHDMSNGGRTIQHTPSHTPTHTPKNGNAHLPTPEHHTHTQQPPPVYHGPNPAQPNHTPQTNNPTHSSGWASVNHTAPSSNVSSYASKPEVEFRPQAPPQGETLPSINRVLRNSPPMPHQPNHHQPSPPHRSLSHPQQPPQPPSAAPSLPPPTTTASSLPPTLPPPHSHPGYVPGPPPSSHSTPSIPPPAPQLPSRPCSPRQEMAIHLQTRFSGAIDKQFSSLEEIRQIHKDMMGLLGEKSSSERRWQDENRSLVRDRDHLRDTVERYKQWNEDLQRGNLELQDFQLKYNDAKKLLQQEEQRAVHYETVVCRQLQEGISDRDRQISHLRKLLSDNGINEHGSRESSNAKEVPDSLTRNREEINDWVEATFTTSKQQEEDLRGLVDGVEDAGLKDLNLRVLKLKSYLEKMKTERETKQHEWQNRFVSTKAYANLSPRLRQDDAGEDADHEGDGDDRVNGTSKEQKPTDEEGSPVVKKENSSTASSPSATTAPDGS